LGVVFFEVNDGKRLTPTASLGCIHAPMLGDICFVMRDAFSTPFSS
jgi:hypothetical protein